MKLSCQEDMIPGVDLKERVRNLQHLGIEGIEITDGAVRSRQREIEEAITGTNVVLSTICIKPSSKFTNILGLLDPDVEERKRTMGEIKALLDVAGNLGATGVIVVPIFGKLPRFPDLSPFRTGRDLEDTVLPMLLSELAEHADKAGTLILLEPVHRYLTHFLTTLEHGARLCDEVDHPHVRVMVDIFQSINEERDVMESIKQYGSYIRHVHLSDNNRLLPGFGSTDFTRVFRTLRGIEFTDYMALECTVKPGDLQQFEQSMRYMRRCLAESTSTSAASAS